MEILVRAEGALGLVLYLLLGAQILLLVPLCFVLLLTAFGLKERFEKKTHLLTNIIHVLDPDGSQWAVQPHPKHHNIFKQYCPQNPPAAMAA